MKKIILTFLAIAAITITACKENFLQRTPINKEVTSDFYKNPDDAFQALVSAYSVLDWNGYGNIVLSSEMTSDDAFGGGGTADNGVTQWDRFQHFTDHNSDAWSKFYAGIYRTNVFLDKIDGVDFGSDKDLKNQYIGEAKFLRAYFYFNLVKMFGHVPLITKPIEGNNYYIPQASPDSVYTRITKDLKDAVTKLTPSAVPYSSLSQDQYGRATKWAAESMLGRVYLYYTGYYNKSDLVGLVSKQDAIKAIDDVINNSGYGLVNNYADLFRASSVSDNNATFAGQNNKEGVFVIQYTDQGKGNWSQQNGNRWQVMIGIRNQSLSPYYKGWGFAPVNPDLWNTYQSGDTRKKASIISIKDEGLDNMGFKVGDQAQYTGYYAKKYTPLQQNNPTNNGGDFQIDNYDNYMAIRFSDVLLMGAELNLSTNLSKAQGYYNRVRDRAFQDQTHRKTLTNDAAGLKLIMRERRLEFALEGRRYWDLLRQGMNTTKKAIDNNPGGSEFKVEFPTETKGLFEIPQTQINLSDGTLEQNPGWPQ